MIKYQIYGYGMIYIKLKVMMKCLNNKKNKMLNQLNYE